jgi:hypothetical protein
VTMHSAMNPLTDERTSISKQDPPPKMSDAATIHKVSESRTARGWPSFSDGVTLLEDVGARAATAHLVTRGVRVRRGPKISGCR